MDTVQTIEDLERQLATRDAEIVALREHLDRQHAQLGELFQINPVPLFVVDRKHIVRNANTRALGALGLTKDKVVRQPFLDLVDASWHRRATEHLTAAQNGQRTTSEIGLVTCDGKTLFARLESMQFEDRTRVAILVAVLVLAQDPANLQLVGDTYDRRVDRVRALSTRYGRT